MEERQGEDEKDGRVTGRGERLKRDRERKGEIEERQGEEETRDI